MDPKLPDGWRWVHFGDVVREVRAATRDPEADGLTRVVGLEHLDSESLPLRRWNELADLPDGTSFTRVFRAGQVLFGKRRAYQRKVAVPDFDGICSSDILVFEPSTDELLPEFLPYVVQSNGFFDHALGTSAGSLSPRTKWQELTRYEFALPRLLDQRYGIALLHAAETTGMAYRRSGDAAQTVVDALIASTADRFKMRNHTLRSVCREPITYGIVQAGPDTPGGIPYVRVSDMTDSVALDPARLPRTTPQIAERYRRSACAPGDLIFALRGPIGLTRVVPPALSGVNLTQGTARLAPDSNKVSTECLEWALRSPYVQKQYERVRKGSTFQEISLGALRDIEILVPDGPTAQSEFVEALNHAARTRASADKSEETAKEFCTRLRESIMAGLL